MTAYVFEVCPENLAFQVFIVLQLIIREICHLEVAFYSTFYCTYRL